PGERAPDLLATRRDRDARPAGAAAGGDGDRPPGGHARRRGGRRRDRGGDGGHPGRAAPAHAAADLSRDPAGPDQRDAGGAVRLRALPVQAPAAERGGAGAEQERGAAPAGVDGGGGGAGRGGAERRDAAAERPDRVGARRGRAP